MRSSRLLAEQLGCYFCNDVVAPANSLARRSMDQQCTVVRPGLARVAAAHAVEMLAALSQHAEFGAAPVGDAHSGGVLGGVPHMLRGTFMGFEQTHMRGVATGACSACGNGVLSAYHAEGAQFVMKVLQVCLRMFEKSKSLSSVQQMEQRCCACTGLECFSTCLNACYMFRDSCHPGSWLRFVIWGRHVLLF